MRGVYAAFALGSTVALLQTCAPAMPPESPAAPATVPAPPTGAPDDAPASSAPAAPAVAPEPLFAREVRPLLERRCSPCHFAGGKMYDRLPFDDPATVRRLGEKLFTRIRDPAEVETLRSFFAAGPPDSKPGKDLG